MGIAHREERSDFIDIQQKACGSVTFLVRGTLFSLPGGHVLYRVTPIFEGNNLLARGVEIEAMSVEDCGRSVAFHVFLYNAQPGVGIDYATGENWRAAEA